MTMRIRLLWISDYSAAMSIEQDRTGAFDSNESNGKFFRLIIPTGMLVLHNGPMWKHHRRIMGQATTGRYLSKSAGQINQSINELVSLWESKTSLATGKAFDVNKDMGNASMVSRWFGVIAGKWSSPFLMCSGRDLYVRYLMMLLSPDSVHL